MSPQEMGDTKWQELRISSKDLHGVLDKLMPFMNSQWPAASDSARATERHLLVHIDTKNISHGMNHPLYAPPSEWEKEFMRIVSEELLHGLPFE